MDQCYFIGNRAEGKVKIGFSSNPQRRIAEIQTGCPFPVEILATEPGGSARESQLHRRFSHLHLNGEWFVLNDEVSRYIAKGDRWRLHVNWLSLQHPVGRSIADILMVATVFVCGVIAYTTMNSIVNEFKEGIERSRAMMEELRDGRDIVTVPSLFPTKTKDFSSPYVYTEQLSHKAVGKRVEFAPGSYGATVPVYGDKETFILWAAAGQTMTVKAETAGRMMLTAPSGRMIQTINGVGYLFESGDHVLTVSGVREVTIEIR